MKKGGFTRLHSELKRRNVYKSALSYVVVSWVLLQVLAVTLPSFDLPLSIIKYTLLALIFGFPLWLLFSWRYELTPDGLKKTVEVEASESISPLTGNRLNRLLIATLGIAVVLLAINAIRTSPEGEPQLEENPQLLNAGLGSLESEPDKHSIAVLAFANMSPDKEQEYFSDGVSEEILNLLAQIPDLRVMSRTSSFSFKGKGATVDEIGEALQVSHILEGSVRRSGNTLRITAQLVKVSDGSHIWSETFDREMDDIFKIQDEIATRVTRELEATLLGDISSKKVDTYAYELYLRAKYQEFSAEGTTRSMDLVRQSIAIDSTYAPSWYLLSRFYSTAGGAFFSIPLPEAISLARQAIDKAIVLDPEYAEAYEQLSSVQMADWEFEQAALNMQKALQLAPDNIGIQIRASMDRFAPVDETIALFRKGIERDPLDYYKYYQMGLYLYWDNQLEEAIEAIETVENQYPNRAILHHLKSKILLAEGKYQEAREEAEKEPDEFYRLFSQCFVSHTLGRQQEADSLLTKFVKDYKDSNGGVNIAEVYAYRGEVDQAFHWLERGLKEKDPTLLEALFYPNFKILYEDPRWNAFLKKMKLPKGHGVPGGKV